jgi:hypothetical protein
MRFGLLYGKTPRKIGFVTSVKSAPSERRELVLVAAIN